jgi:hypothetical protein
MDTLWSDYEEFENGMNPVLVRYSGAASSQRLGFCLRLSVLYAASSVLPPGLYSRSKPLA